jgi:uroporphyrinogen decarboxylase
MSESIFLNALQCKPTKRPAFWMMRQSGRYLPEYRKIRATQPDFLSMIQNPEITCELAMLPMRRFNLDAAIVFSDILLVPNLMGAKLQFKEGEGPVFSTPIQSEAALSQLKEIDVRQKLSCVTESIQRLIAELGPRTPVIGFCGSPWTCAMYLVEGQARRYPEVTLGWTYEQPNLMHQLLTLLTQVHAEYLIMQADAGAKALMIFDSHAGFLAENCYHEFSADYIGQIIETVQKSHPNIPIIVYSKGHQQAPIILANTTNVQGLGVDWTVNLKSLRKQLPKRTIALQGNLHPSLMSVENTHALQAALKHQYEQHPGPGHILNLGHGILPSANISQVATVIDYLRSIESVRTDSFI